MRAAIVLLTLASGVRGADATVGQLVSAIRAKAETLESRADTREGFERFVSTFKLRPGAVNYSDYVVARLVF